MLVESSIDLPDSHTESISSICEVTLLFPLYMEFLMFRVVKNRLLGAKNDNKSLILNSKFVFVLSLNLMSLVLDSPNFLSVRSICFFLL